MSDLEDSHEQVRHESRTVVAEQGPEDIFDLVSNSAIELLRLVPGFRGAIVYMGRVDPSLPRQVQLFTNVGTYEEPNENTTEIQILASISRWIDHRMEDLKPQALELIKRIEAMELAESATAPEGEAT